MITSTLTPALNHKQQKLAQLGIPLFSPRYGDRLSATLANQSQRSQLSGADRLVAVTEQLIAPSADEQDHSPTSLGIPESPVVLLPDVAHDPFHPQHQVAAEQWPDLCCRICECPAPSLTTQPAPILGDGDANADWLLVGDAPGMVEEQSGKAYAGKAGQLLDQLFRALQVSRASGLYLTHLVKHRLPNDRDPLPEEIDAGWHYLLNEIHLIQPKMIVVVGRLAAQQLLQTSAVVGNLRGQIHAIKVRAEDTPIPVLVTHSPSYLMQSPSQKANAWDDILLACQHLQNRTIPSDSPYS